MRRTTLMFLFSVSLAVGASATPSAERLVPSVAPRGATLLIVGRELDGVDVTVAFPAPNGQTIAGDLTARTARTIELRVPAGAASGKVKIVARGSVVAALDFELAQDPRYVSVTTVARELKEPSAAAVVVPDGRIFVADALHHQIRVIAPTGEVTVFAGSGAPGFENGAGALAAFKEPRGLAYDHRTNVLYVADSGNNAIRAINAAGIVRTVAGSGKAGDRNASGAQAEFKSPTAVAVDTAGVLYVADSGNHRIRRITPAGDVTTLAGSGEQKFIDGPAAQAAFSAPEGICVSRTGTIFVADTKNHVIRLIERGTVSTLAGTGRRGYADGTATRAEMSDPRGVAEDDAGDLLVVDSQNGRLRKIVRDATRATVTTIAGNGRIGSVDGPVKTAEFKEPAGLSHAGALFVADTKNDAVRAIWPEVRATAVYPPSGSLQSGKIEVRVFGSGFVPGRTEVRFGDRDPAAVTFVSATELLVASAVFQAAGKVDVTVTTPAGTSTAEDAYSPDADAPKILATISPTATAHGWRREPTTVRFVCFDVTSGIATCPAPQTIRGEGAGQQVSGTATDLAGNFATATAVVNIDATAPVLTVAALPEVTRESSIVVRGTATDALSGVKTLTCNGGSAVLQGSSFSCAVSLLVGTNTIRLEAGDGAGNTRETIVTLVSDTTAPALAFRAPANDDRVNTGVVSVEIDAADDDRVAAVTVSGVPAVLNGGVYRAAVNLLEGNNTLTAHALDRAGNAASRSRDVHYFSLPAITIATPVDLGVVSSSTVTVSGTVSGSGVAVAVNGVSATVNGGTFSAADIPLVQGRTVITATATNAAGHVAAANIHVYRDSLPPRVAVYTPAADEIVFQTPITVSGMIDDVAVGTINSGQAKVTVNGIAADVANRAFTAQNVPLAPGLNVLNVVAIDRAGNQVSKTHRVMLQPSTSGNRIVRVSGGDQQGSIGADLRDPLVVRVTDASGSPLSGRLVKFDVVQNNGTVANGTTASRSLMVATDASGEATVRWRLGTRAGAGNQRVEATAADAHGKATFSASGHTTEPHHIVVDSGNNQFGVIGQRLQRPIVAVVVDEGSNRLANVPVTFTVSRGDGSLDGYSSVTLPTDSDGRAWVLPTLGPDEGPDNNVISATVTGITGSAVFYASGRPAGREEDTRISGVVVDNTNIPVAGVSIRVEGTALASQTDGEGRFVIAAAPVGYVKLVIDGSTAQRPGTWPTLEFAMYTNAGQENTLGMPIYMLPIDVARGIQVSEQVGGTLTLPELPGFSLTIAPGSATFPNGTRAGTVSVTLVHSDKMPMPPGFGQQPRFIVTIQPTGVHFDPPAAITFPNVDGLRPGQVTEMYSFDHDLGHFVAIGTASVSDDGTMLRSDAGVGIIKGGWHCGGDPTPTGTPADCGECGKCVGATCEPDPLRAGRQCSSDGDACTDDICSGGQCAHPALSSTLVIEGVYVDRDDRQRTWSNFAARLFLGQPLYGNPTVGDHVRWRLTANTTKPVSGYRWRAEGPMSVSGPGTREWQIDNIAWKPGLYDVIGEVTFQGGCKVTSTWKQWVGIRTNEYFAAGSIQPMATPTEDVSSKTISLFTCPLAIAPLLFSTGLPPEMAFNAPVSTPLGLPMTYADRRYANARLFTLIANQVPVPSINPLFPDADEDYGLSSDIDYRFFIRGQFKYLVRDGKLLFDPQPVGRNRVKVGETTSPCGTYLLINLDAIVHPDNGRVFGGAGDEEFYYIVKVRAGEQDQVGYASLNGRALPWVFLKLRFNTNDGELHTDFDAPSSWHGLSEYGGTDDGRDFTYFPTLFVFRRDGPTEYSLVRRVDQQMDPFIESSPILKDAAYVYPLDGLP